MPMFNVNFLNTIIRAMLLCCCLIQNDIFKLKKIHLKKSKVKRIRKVKSEYVFRVKQHFITTSP